MRSLSSYPWIVTREKTHLLLKETSLVSNSALTMIIRERDAEDSSIYFPSLTSITFIKYVCVYKIKLHLHNVTPEADKDREWSPVQKTKHEQGADSNSLLGRGTYE